MQMGEYRGNGTVRKTDPALLIEKIYEAALVPEMWPGVLRSITTLTGTAWSTMLSLRPDAQRWILSHPEADEVVAAHFDQFSGNQRTTRFIEQSPSHFITDFDLLTEEEIVNEPVYQEMLIPAGFGYGAASVLAAPDGNVIAFHTEGYYRNGPISETIVGQLESLRPHLARAAMISARLSFQQARTAVDTLAAIGLAACGVSYSGTVLVANAAFELEDELLTMRGSDRIAVRDQRANILLLEALEHLERDGMRSIPLLPTFEGKLPGVLHVVPVHRTTRDLFGSVTAILVLTKATSVPSRANSLLQALFDLTPMEAELAARIAAGQTSEAIALADGKTVGTVRHQLKNVLAKTGCRRQAELARLLTQIVPAGM
jgi:DNA-binding CsgD family transcriptional regulator